MSSPTPNDAAAASNQGSNQGKGKDAPKVKLLDVVEYRHKDTILGHDFTHVGVVVRDASDGGSIAVRPLENRHLEVDPADVTPISADDL